MKSQTIVSPDDQNVTFIELFFDLVFVFSVTQVVSFILFVGGMAVAVWRATGRILLPRVILSVVTAIVVVVVSGIPLLLTLAIPVVGLIVIAVLEQRSDSLAVHESSG